MCDFLAGVELFAGALELIAPLTLLGLGVTVVLHAHDLRVLQMPDLLLKLLEIALPVLRLNLIPFDCSLIVEGASHGYPFACGCSLPALLVDVLLRGVAILDLPVIAPHCIFS